MTTELSAKTLESIKGFHNGNNAKTYKNEHRSTLCRFGTIQTGELCKPSYSGIETVNKINDPDNDLIHVVEITPDYAVLFNSAEIASGPVPYTGKGKGRSVWTPAKRLAFCKAVIYSIIPRPTERFDTKKGKMQIDDDSELRRYIALYPALASNQNAEMQQIMADEMPIVVPEVITVQEPARDILPVLAEGLGLTEKEIDGHPDAEELFDLQCNDLMQYEVELEYLECDLREAFFEDKEPLDYPDEYIPAISEMWALINPVMPIIRQWTHRGMSIIEEMISA